MVALVRARGEVDQVLVSCFHRPTLERIRALEPAIATAFLFVVVEGTWEELAADLAESGHVPLHPWDGMVGEALVAAAHDHGLEVNVWTVDDPARMAELVALGVDGLCTNVPDVARRLVDEAAAG